MTKSDEPNIEAKSRYNRIAPIYDLLEFPMEKLLAQEWRQRVWSRVESPVVLEVGVGTGKNIPYYPERSKITAVDLSVKMLKKAQARAGEEKEGKKLSLLQMDVQKLDFPENTFDTTVATFVFCSVSDPIQGLREINRVTKSEGEVLLLEHVRPDSWFLGNAFDLLNPVSVRLIGVNINRKTVKNVRAAGLEIKRVSNLTRGNIVKMITAKPGT
ncbi:class I SAM-dependent methyltransferase [Candidatus Bipolaricaulota bacterium]|nr:class I SAM-dependent methyltransferase [Candidatus Bipolaricaulota bacterium]